MSSQQAVTDIPGEHKIHKKGFPHLQGKLLRLFAGSGRSANRWPCNR